MITIPGNGRVFLFSFPVDMRKSFEGLSSQVECAFNEKITSGAFFVFLNRVRDRMKVIYWDGDGLAIWYKRLEKGSFRMAPSGNPNLSRREFLMLLEGITPKRINPRYSLS